MPEEDLQRAASSAPSLPVRLARPEDDAAVGELLVKAFTDTYARKMPEVVVTEQRRAELRAVASRRATASVWVAEKEGRVVGTVALFPPGAAGSEAWLPGAADLRQLAVDPALHGQGVAKALLDEAERAAKAWPNVHAICLHVRRGAHGVARLYQSRGYQRDPAGDMEKPAVSLEAYVLRLAADAHLG